MNDLMTKSFMSYTELKKQALKDLEAGAGSRDLDASGLTRPEEDNLAPFFEEIDAVQSTMNDVSSLLADLQSLHQESKSVHSAKVLRGVRDRMDSDIAAILRQAKATKSRLAALDRHNADNHWAFPEGSPVDRTRTSVTNGVRAKLGELMKGFQALRELILVEHKEGLKRRYFNATGEVATEEVLDEMFRGRSQVGMLDDKGQVDVEVLERQKAVNNIQRSLAELHRLFLDMAVMLEAQEEGLNNIEENVVRAKDFIGSGTDGLAATSALKKKSRMMKYVVWALLAILVLVCMILIITGS